MAKPALPHEGISVVIPVHNGGDRLEKVVPSWGDALARLGREYEIIVVNDGSTDATAAALERLAAGRVKHLTVSTHHSNKGFGACLRTALEQARQPLFFYTAVDYLYSPADLAKLLQRIEIRDTVLNKQPDLINGCRTGRPVPTFIQYFGKFWRGLWRVVLGLHVEPLPAWPGLRGYLYGMFTGWVFGVPLADVNSKYKLYRTAFLKRFPIQSDSEFVHTELVAKGTFLTSIMDEIPLTPAAPTNTKTASIWKDFWRVFNDPDFGNPVAPIPGEPTSTSPPDVPIARPDAVADGRGPDRAPPTSLAFAPI
jgi:glycosyltransferase involved in cell wall biosynthesis